METEKHGIQIKGNPILPFRKFYDWILENAQQCKL